MSQGDFTQDNLSTFVALPVENYDNNIIQLGENISIISNAVLKPLSNGVYCIIDGNNANIVENISQVKMETFVNNDNAAPELPIVEHFINTIPEENYQHITQNPAASVYTCTKCDQEFEKLGMYKKHMIWHRNMKKFKCDKCPIGYNVEENLKVHQAMHADGKPTCPVCKISFQRLASLKSHLMLHQIEELYTCEECQSEFEREDELTKHLQTHLNVAKENKELICQYCRVAFEDQSLFKEHIAHHIKIKKLVLSGKRTRKTHGNREYRHVCGVCQKSFSKASLLERHSRVHSGEKPFMCEYCNRSFNQKCTLHIHMTKHTGVKPYRCTLCPAAFHQKGNLRVHVEKTHTAPSPGVKIYSCAHCSCIFKKIASLNIHITKVHGGAYQTLTNKSKNVDQKEQIVNKVPLNSTNSDVKELDKIDENSVYSYMRIAGSCADGMLRRYLVKHKKIGDSRWYICNYCSKEVKRPSDLIRHTRIHTRERPYSCKICHISFALKSTLHSHLRTHNNKNHYMCPICSKKFSSARAVNIHLRNHSDLQTQPFKCVPCNKWFSNMERVKSHKEKHRKEQQLGLIPTIQVVESPTQKVDQINVAGEIEPVKEQTEFQLLVQTSSGLVPLSSLSSNIITSSTEIQKDLGQITNTDNNSNSNKSGIVMKPPLLQTSAGLLPMEPLSTVSENEKQHECQFCHAKFMKLRSLKRHLIIHLGEREYKCEYCPKAFFTAHALKEHTMHHTGTKMYGCKDCGKKFVTASILKRHRLSHNPINSFICPYCGKGFKSLVLCKKHIWTHRKEVEAAQQDNKKIQIDPDSMLNVDNDPLLVGTNRDKRHEEKDENELLLPGEHVLQQSEVVAQNLIDNSLFELVPNSIQIFSNNVKDSNTNEGQNQEQVRTILINCNELQLTDNGANLYPKTPIEGTDPLFFNHLDFQDNNVFNIDPINSDLEQILNAGQITTNVESTELVNSAKRIITVKNQVKSENFSDGFCTNNQLSLPINFPQDSFQPNNIDVTTAASIVSDGIINPPLATVFNLQQDFTTSTTAPSTTTTIEETAMEQLNAANETVANNIISTIVEKVPVVPANSEKVRGLRRKFVCMHCRRVFANKTTYSKHLDNHNKRSKSQPIMRHCTYCEKVFKKQSDLIRHIRIHTGEKPFACDKCDKRFTLKSTLLSHQRTHNPISHKKFNCHVCNSFFTSKSSLKVHMNVHTGNKPHACTFCSLKFHTAANKKYHESMHYPNAKNSSGDKSLSGDDEKNSTLLAALETLPADQTILNQTENQVSIEVLSHRLDQNDSLQQDVVQNNVIVVQDPLQLQSESNLMSDSNTNLNDTIQMDSALLQQIQSSNFFLQDQLISSSLIQLIQDDGTLLNIKIPDHDLVEKDPKVSSTTNKQANVVNGKPRNLECDICHKMYASKDVLRRHRKNHGINKKFPCDKCDKGFDTELQLEKHNKLHSGYRPYTCMYCNNSFAKQQSLTTHIKRIHPLVNNALKEDVFLNFS